MLLAKIKILNFCQVIHIYHSLKLLNLIYGTAKLLLMFVVVDRLFINRFGLICQNHLNWSNHKLAYKMSLFERKNYLQNKTSMNFIVGAANLAFGLLLFLKGYLKTLSKNFTDITFGLYPDN